VADREVVAGLVLPADKVERTHAVALRGVLLADFGAQFVIVERGGGHQADDEGRAALASAVARLGGPLDIVIHNAGMQQALDYASGAIGEAADREIAVNLIAPIRLTETLLPHMGRGGTICFLTSVLAYKPKTSAPVYCASKAGLRSFALALRRQLAPQGLRVVEIVPPLVATAMTGGRGRGKISPEKAARAILTGLGAGNDRIAIGKARPALALDRWAPRLLSRMMARQ